MTCRRQFYKPFRLGYEPCVATPSEGIDRFLEWLPAAIEISGQKCNVLGRKSGPGRQVFERLPPSVIYRSVRRHDLDKNKQRMRGPEVDEDGVRKILMRLDIQAYPAGEVVIASDNLVTAFAYKQYRRLLKEFGRENFNHRFRNPGARSHRHTACFTIWEGYQHVAAAGGRAVPNKGYSGEHTWV